MRTLIVCLAAVVPAASLHAGTITFNNPGDVVLSPTQAAGTWYTDRYAPADFESGQSGGGRTGVLHHGISSADSQANRPGFNTAFYNTQGRKFDLNSGATTLYVDLYVSSDWESIAQSEGRFASIWGTGIDGGGTIAEYPIIEFNNLAGGGSGGFRIWDSQSGTWDDVGGFGDYDEWYRIGFELTAGGFVYSVDGSNVFTDAALGSESLENVILQGYNDGNNYDIYWDNLESNGITSAVPEPASFCLMSLGGIALFGFGLRRRRKSAATAAA